MPTNPNCNITTSGCIPIAISGSFSIVAAGYCIKDMDCTTPGSTCINNQCAVQATQCSNLYWFDNTYQGSASQKQFCGSYMYQGLKTFSSQLLCQMAVLQKQLNKTCNTNSDCLSGQVCNSGVCGTATQPSVQSFTITPASVNPNSYPNAYDIKYSLNNASAIK